MPGQDEIARIERQFAKQYGLDLDGIHRDARALRTLIADTTATSKAVDDASYTYNGSQAIVPDLETIAFNAIEADPRIAHRRVELNVDEATAYLQMCLDLRKEYGEAAKLRNDTRFKGEEFVRLDGVHLFQLFDFKFVF